MNRGGCKERKRVRERERERERERSTLQEFHFDASSPTRLVSQRIFIQDAIRPRGRSQERSVEKRSTIFRREVEFHSILEFSHECIFYHHRNRNWVFWLAQQIPRDIFLSMKSLNDKCTFLLFRYRHFFYNKIESSIYFTNNIYYTILI